MRSDSDPSKTHEVRFPTSGRYKTMGVDRAEFGIVQLLDHSLRGHEAFPQLVRILQELCEAAATAQAPDGGFHSILDDARTPICIHDTSWFGASFLRGIRMGYLDPKFLDPSLQCWHALKSRIISWWESQYPA